MAASELVDKEHKVVFEVVNGTLSFTNLQEFVQKMKLNKRCAPEAIREGFWNLSGALGNLLWASWASWGSWSDVSRTLIGRKGFLGTKWEYLYKNTNYKIL